MNDDLNTPILISYLFDGVKTINSIIDGRESISADDLKKLENLYNTFVFEILGLKNESKQGGGDEKLGEVVDLLLNLRLEAKSNRDFETSDRIRDELQNLGFTIKDKKDGFDWELDPST